MEEAFVVVIVVGLYLWLCWFIAKQFYEVAQMKGYSDKKYFWITFWLGPIGYALVIALPNRNGNTVGGGTYMPEVGNNSSVFYDDLPDL